MRPSAAPPTEAVGEIGAEDGLVVRLRTYTHMRAELLLYGQVLGSAPVENALHGGTWAALNVTLDGVPNVSVYVSYGGKRLLDAVRGASRVVE